MLRALLIACLLVGCAGPVVADVEVPPPEPVPRPVEPEETSGGGDPDEDGVLADADDCPVGEGGFAGWSSPPRRWSGSG